jgi:phosphate ABC transporter phosphate-binding protein
LPLQSSDISGLPSGTTVLTIPVSASAVVPAYNIPLGSGTVGNDLNFTGSILAQIFMGTITNWNDPQIAAINPGTTLPNHQIITVHRSDGSGTMFAFTDYLSQASSDWNTQIGKGKLVNWPNPGGVAVAAKGNGGVAQAIIANQYSIGPLEIAYEIQNSGQISYGAVQNAAQAYILANATTNVKDALQAGASSGLPAGNNMAAWSSFSIIDNIYSNATASTAYPITTLTYALVYQDQHYSTVSQAQAAGVVNFISWVVNYGQSFGPSLGYAPLPANIVAVDNITLKIVNYNGTAILS